MKAILVGLGVLLSASPALPCNETNHLRRVVGVAPDGTFVVREGDAGGFGDNAGVQLVAPDGASRSRCRTGDVEGASIRGWRCDGARPPSLTSRRAPALAASWATAVAADAPLTPIAVPVGVIEAMCARLPQPLGSCDVTSAAALTASGSALIFLRYRLAPFPDCGATSSYDDTSWMSRAALATRLRGRVAYFRRHGRADLAARADEALRWLAS